jgi:nucleoside transporter
MDTMLYVKLSLMMALQYAIWGAWAPVLAARLLGPLKMTGKQTGWIYGTLPLAFIVAPLVAGQIADRWVATEHILLVAHLLGAGLLMLASQQKKFNRLFMAMGAYSLFYAATVPLVNSLMFTHLTDPDNQSGKIFIWAPIAWVVSGLLLTGLRKLWSTGEKTQGSDCLILAAGLSLLMAIICLILPNTPPQGSTGGDIPIVKAFALMGQFNFSLILIISMIVMGVVQFYYLGTAQFLGDVGIKSNNIPAVMTTAQAAQTIATWFALAPLLAMGYHGLLTIGIGCWFLMFLFYAMTKPPWLVVLSQSLHGVAYVLFVIGGQIYVNTIAEPAYRSSAQALIFAIVMGIGAFAGMQMTGIIMDRNNKDGQFQWRSIYAIPCALLLVCTLVFFFSFRT